MHNSPLVIDGIEMASAITEDLSEQLITLKKHNITPGLGVVVVGNNPVSKIYVDRKRSIAEAIGINSYVIELEENISQANLRNKIHHLNSDPKINGILVQMPLPSHIDSIDIINAIDPAKDVDGFTTENIGKLITKQHKCLIPCTPQGVMLLIKSVEPILKGKHAVVVGRSNIVGRPISNLLLNEDCTVTIVHSHTKNPQKICKTADILIAAAGSKRLIKEDWVKNGAIVIDVGINRVNTKSGRIKIIGDVDFKNVVSKVKAITPVPGGVGPMTIACLLKNTINATCWQRGFDLLRDY